MSQEARDATPADTAADALRTLAAALSQDAAAINSLGRAELGFADQLELGPAIARAREALAAAYADSAQRVVALAATVPAPAPAPAPDSLPSPAVLPSPVQPARNPRP